MAMPALISMRWSSVLGMNLRICVLIESNGSARVHRMTKPNNHPPICWDWVLRVNEDRERSIAGVMGGNNLDDHWIFPRIGSMETRAVVCPISVISRRSEFPNLKKNFGWRELKVALKQISEKWTVRIWRVNFRSYQIANLIIDIWSLPKKVPIRRNKHIPRLSGRCVPSVCRWGSRSDRDSAAIRHSVPLPQVPLFRNQSLMRMMIRDRIHQRESEANVAQCKKDNWNELEKKEMMNAGPMV
jgi:hypothetical protein